MIENAGTLGSGARLTRTLLPQSETKDFCSFIAHLTIDTAKNLAVLVALSIIFFSTRWLQQLGMYTVDIRHIQQLHFWLTYAVLVWIGISFLVKLYAVFKMIRVQAFRQLSEDIATDYVKSWLIGIWFTIPFALTGFIVEVGFRLDFKQALLGASLVGILFVLIKACSEAHNIGALGNIGPQAILALTDALRDSDSKVRSAAAEALGKMGLQAAAALPALTAALRDPDSDNRLLAAEAIRRIKLNSRKHL